MSLPSLREFAACEEGKVQLGQKMLRLADEVLVCLYKREPPACRSLLRWLGSSLIPLEREGQINKGIPRPSLLSLTG